MPAACLTPAAVFSAPSQERISAAVLTNPRNQERTVSIISRTMRLMSVDMSPAHFEA
jgi:hypothetical protein